MELTKESIHSELIKICKSFLDTGGREAVTIGVNGENDGPMVVTALYREEVDMDEVQNLDDYIISSAPGLAGEYQVTGRTETEDEAASRALSWFFG